MQNEPLKISYQQEVNRQVAELIVHNCMDSARYLVQTMNIVKKKEKYIPTLYPPLYPHY